MKFQQHSSVTVIMGAFHAGGEGSNPTQINFLWKHGKYLRNIVSCKSCIMFIFSFIYLNEYSGVVVRMIALQAGDQGSNSTRTFSFFILNGHIFLQFHNFIFLILFLNDMNILCVNMLVMIWTIKIYALN